MKDIGKLIEEFEQSRELDIWRQIKALKISFQVFRANYNEVRELAHLSRDPEVLDEILGVKNKPNLEAVMQEDLRRMHNFLASAMSLIGHTGVTIRRLYRNTNFIEEYHAKFNSHFEQNPLFCFIKGLRIYCQHYELPIAQTKVTFDHNSEEVTFGINVRKLQKWKNWSKLSKTYMESLGDHLPTEVLADDYFSHVKDFYKWLERRQISLHKKDFERLEQRRKELQKIFKKYELNYSISD